MNNEFKNMNPLYVFGRRYNVQYEITESMFATLNNVLHDVNDKYYIFYSITDGFDMIRKDKIVHISCTDRRELNEC